MNKKRDNPQRGLLYCQTAICSFMVVIDILTGLPTFGTAFFFLGVVCMAHLLVFQPRLRRRCTLDHPRCARCGYNLVAHVQAMTTANGVCPECGSSLTSADIVPAGQLHRREYEDTELQHTIWFLMIASMVYLPLMFYIVPPTSPPKWWLAVVTEIACLVGLAVCVRRRGKNGFP